MASFTPTCQPCLEALATLWAWLSGHAEDKANARRRDSGTSARHPALPLGTLAERGAAVGDHGAASRPRLTQALVAAPLEEGDEYLALQEQLRLLSEGLPEMRALALECKEALAAFKTKHKRQIRALHGHSRAHRRRHDEVRAEMRALRAECSFWSLSVREAQRVCAPEAGPGLLLVSLGSRLDNAAARGSSGHLDTDTVSSRSICSHTESCWEMA